MLRIRNVENTLVDDDGGGDGVRIPRSFGRRILRTRVLPLPLPLVLPQGVRILRVRWRVLG